MSAALSIARVSILRAVRRPSSWWLSALAFLPAALGRLARGHGLRRALGPAPLLVYVAAPLLVVPWAAGVLGEAFERRTVIYWFVRPMARPTALLGEWLGSAAAVGTVLLLGGAMLAVANALTGNAAISSLARLPIAMLAEAVALAGFSVGVATLAPKHPVSVAIGALAVTEVALPSLWGPLQVVSLAPGADPRRGGRLPPASQPGGRGALRLRGRRAAGDGALRGDPARGSRCAR